MAINQNHTFEDLDGVKCAIVEKGVSLERSQFLRELLEFNGYTVIIVPAPAPKTTTKPVAASADDNNTGTPQFVNFVVGVSDVTFNSVNAIYGRQLYTPGGHIVTPTYWQQKESVSHDEIPYYQKRK